jgi:putative transposase
MRYRRILVPGGTFFFTVITYRRRKLFSNHENISHLSHAIDKVQIAHPFKVIAQVVLPDHIHAIWELPEGDHDYPTRWRLIKTEFSKQMPKEFDPIGTSSRQIKHERTIWQRRYWEHTIRDDLDLDHHIDYIHFNPVHHGLAKYPHEWKNSTFQRFVDEGYYPLDWATENIFIGIGAE